MRVNSLVLSCMIYLLKFCHFTSADIPNCAFEDTVELKKTHKQSNDSYVYEGVLVPAHMRGYYDYVELFNGVRTNVPKHLRGCVCQLKRCVKFCCSSGIPLFRPTKKAPVECDVDKKEYSPLVNITLPDSSRVVMNVLDKFVVQQGIPCGDGYMLLPHLYEEDQWELYENGTIVRKLDNLPRSRRDYCLTVFNSPLATKFELFPLYCDKVDAFGTIKISTTCMMISAPFLYLTILIYWVVPKLWNLHSKCLICYLLSLAIGTTLIVVINMSTSEYPIAVCATMGFFAYYFLLAVFFWLNVICFDLWQIFRGNISNIGHMSEAQRFRYYSLYAWGLPAVMTVITVGLQYSNLPAELQSGIGDTHCWLNTEEWSAMLYFYGPCLILILSNIAMFYSTVRRIYNIRREVQKLTQDDYTLRRMRGHQNNTWLFFRLFILMGITWLLETFNYLAGDWTGYEYLNAILNAVNALQGIIVFALLVMKKKVLLLIKRVICESIGKYRKRKTPTITTGNLNRPPIEGDEPHIQK